MLYNDDNLCDLATTIPGTPARSPISTTSTTKSGSTRSGSSSSSVYTDPGVSRTAGDEGQDVDAFGRSREKREQDFLWIKYAYKNALGESIKAPVAWYIEQKYSEGMEAQVICHALEETAWARRPSPQYFRAVMERYSECGIKTRAALKHDYWEHEQKKPWYED